jgi:tripartite-type tricarboxylate transporter receptor subunit TctC
MRTLKLLSAALLALALAGLAGIAQAQAKDNGLPEVLRVFVGFPAGGATDALTRRIAENLRTELGRNVIVVNQPGATGMLSIEQLKKAPNDGSVVSLIPLTSALIFPMFRTKVPFDFQNDFEPIASMVTYPLAFSVSNKLNVSDWRAYVAWARRHPDELFYGHGGTGSMAQLVGAMVGQAAEIKLHDVPYRGGADLAMALVAGQVQAGVNVTGEVSAHHQAGKLRILAVSSKARTPALPDTPTFTELGYPTVQSEPWFGFFAPKGISAKSIATWNRAINAALQDPKLKEFLVGQGYFIAGGTPEQLKAVVHADADRWRKVMGTAGFKATE